MINLLKDKRIRQLIVPFFKIKKAMKSVRSTQLGGENQILHFLAHSHRGKMQHHHILVRGDKILPSDIAKHTHMSSARVASALNVLEKKGFIQRFNSKSDRRKVYVSITRLGVNEMKARFAELVETFTHVFDKLTKKESNEFIRIMNKIADIVSNGY
jgi:DNA-binding MarR family transcriptional regulator